MVVTYPVQQGGALGYEFSTFTRLQACLNGRPLFKEVSKMKQEDLVNLAFNILKTAVTNDTSPDTTMDVANDVSTPESADKDVERTTPSNNINDDSTNVSNTDRQVDTPVIQPQAGGKSLDDIYASIERLTKAIQLNNVNNANQPGNSSVESIAEIQQKLLR